MLISFFILSRGINQRQSCDIGKFQEIPGILKKKNLETSS